jgi:hypothetical protein
MQEENCQKNLNNHALETSITKQRLTRFLANSPYDLDKALDIYLWNCRLSQAFIFPLHVCEITCRNAIQGGLQVRFKNPWYEQHVFTGLLDLKHRNDLSHVVEEETALHQAKMNDGHIVSSLTFGFWEHLTTKRFDRTLWLRGIRHNFPNAYSDGLTIREVSSMIQTVRQWRNRVMHHRALFDKEPDRKLDEIIKLIGFRCSRTAAWTKSYERVSDVLNEKPT